MDAITHGLVGGLIARLGPTEKLGGVATAVGAIAAALPDVDYALFVAGPGAYYCNHRTVTHSVLGALVIATVVAAFGNAASGRKAFGAFWGVALAGVLSHIVLDALSPFGALVFFPFTERRLAFDVLNIVDPWVSLIAFVATAVGFSARHRARAALFGLALLVGYVGGCLVVRHLALERTREEAKGILGVQRVAVLPVPMLPFSWYGVVDAKGAYYVYEVRGSKSDLVRVVEKALDTRWVQAVRQDPVSAPYFRVARFPVIEEKLSEMGHRVQVHDLGLELAAGRPYFVLKSELDEDANVLQIRVLLRDEGEGAK